MNLLPVKKETNIKKEDSDNILLDNSAYKNERNTSQDGWQEIPLKCTGDDIQDIRCHIMKFHSKQDVDIGKNFTRPVRLHRKDPRNIQFHLTREEIDRRKKEENEAKVDKEQKSENEESNPNEPDMSQVAPDGGARRSKKSLFKRKTRQVNLMDPKKRKLRYEEYYPWVMEDYDGQNVFVGNYEAGLSDTQHVLFVFDKDGFRMVPAEKVYKFTPRNKYATLTLEEAEAKMEKNSSVPRWLMKHMEESNGQDATPDQRFRRPASNGNVSVPSAAEKRRLRMVSGGANPNDRDSDHDEIDFDEEFADDEEAPIIDGDEEENKLSEQKIKKEMLKAAHFDGQSDAEGDDDDINDLFEVEKSRKVDKEGRKLRKFLNKTEGGVYDSDDDDNLNPYLSKSDLESNDESDDEITVKQEDNDALLKDGSDAKSGRRNIFVNDVGNGFVVIKAPLEFLKSFPPGDWNPNTPKRAFSTETESNKKAKRDDDSSVKLKLSLKNNGSSSNGNTPTPSETGAYDLNSAGPGNMLVTVNEVLDIVKNKPLTTKELLFNLKSRVNSHKDNKQRIINIVKQNLKLADGKLVLKEQ